MFVILLMIDTVIIELERGLCNSLQWFEFNQLAANPAKFQMIFLGYDASNLSLKIGNIIIKNSKFVKLLGVTIDSKLKFDKHVNNICKKENFKFRSLSRIRRYLKNRQALRLCNAFVLSNFNYCTLIWTIAVSLLTVELTTCTKGL